MNKRIQTVLLSILLALSFNSYATDWYTVEVIIFANNDNAALDDEYWAEINEVPLRSAISLAAPAKSDEDLSSFQKLPESLLNLHQEQKQLQKSGKYRVLYHEGWMQPVDETQNPKPVRIQGGNILDNGMYELDGYIGVGKGRYLHFRPDLYFSRSLSTQESNLLLKTKQENVADLTDTLAAPTASNAVATTRPLEIFIPDVLTVNLNQARRMRSKELHFIDHPLFGVLVEMKPVE